MEPTFPVVYEREDCVNLLSRWSSAHNFAFRMLHCSNATRSSSSNYTAISRGQDATEDNNFNFGLGMKVDRNSISRSVEAFVVAAAEIKENPGSLGDLAIGSWGMILSQDQNEAEIYYRGATGILGSHTTIPVLDSSTTLRQVAEELGRRFLTDSALAGIAVRDRTTAGHSVIPREAIVLAANLIAQAGNLENVPFGAIKLKCPRSEGHPKKPVIFYDPDNPPRCSQCKELMTLDEG